MPEPEEHGNGYECGVRPTMSKLTACKDCKWLWENDPHPCWTCGYAMQNEHEPVTLWNCFEGRLHEVTKGRFRINAVGLNTDGHCPHFQEKED